MQTKRIRRLTCLGLGSLLISFLLGLPHIVPGFAIARDLLVIAFGVIGILAMSPALWNLRMRVAHAERRWISGVLSVSAGSALLFALWFMIIFLTMPVGFMQTRAEAYVIRSSDDRVVYYGHYWLGWEHEFISAELAQQFGPFQIVVWRGENDQNLDVQSWGHHFRKQPLPDGGSEAWIDGQPAIVELREVW